MFWLCESEATTQRHDVGHEGVIKGCDAFSLRSSIADPQEVASLDSNQLLYIIYVLTNANPNF